ncbi:DeoR/GlpR family DNA-binding transcription regulator [Micromonospora sp. NPDC047738]|uniref:DeoR/GlpR family DNA-binding transcription regulator n=1 Tax=unclassified Micromonospora TaxID=2617518 RepID=UPI0033DACB71
MDAAQRRHHILTLARRHGEVDVQKLAADLGVAPETVRRDLSMLAQQGAVRRTHGGAYPVETARFETTLETRTTRMVAEKRRIAAAAVEHVGDAESIFIDEGYTPQLIAEALPTHRPLTVVTASLHTAAALAHSPTLTVLLLGGRVRGRTLATVDHWATAMLAGFVIDLAFVGANGISREHGLTTPDPAVAAVKAQAIGVARRAVFAGVHTKFGGHSFCRFADVADVDTIVTDTALPASEAHRYSLLGPVVLRV